MKRFFIALLFLAPLPLSAQTTWYVRADGGTRYSSNNPAGQCDGKHNAPYPGSGKNQRCAFKDARSLWSDPYAYADQHWVGAGGDTYMIMGTTPMQMAGSRDSSVQGNFGWGVGTNIAPPELPSGTSARHTRLLGENFASCSTSSANASGFTLSTADPTKTAKLWGGGGAAYVLQTSGSAFVDVECLDITDHSSCGSTATSGCNGTDFTQYGIWTGGAKISKNHDILLQDLNIHGLSSRGIQGNIGGKWTVNRVEIARNAGSGWDLDPGNGEGSTGTVTATSLGIDWNGCGEEYPMTDPIPVLTGSCTDQSHGGYGDGLGTPVMEGFNFSCDKCWATYNTQDGYDLGHTIGGTISFTDSWMEGNMGGNIKIGPASQVTIKGNRILANCSRMHDAIKGVPAGYNAHLGDFCRANDQNGSNLLTNSIYVGQAAPMIGITVKATNATHWLTDLAVGDSIVMAPDSIRRGRRRVVAIASDTSFTVDFPLVSRDSVDIIKLPPGGPASKSVIHVTGNTFAGYGESEWDNSCMTGTLSKSGILGQAVVNNDHCSGYTLVFNDNVNVAYRSPNYSTPHAPVMWGGIAPTAEDGNVFYGFYGNSGFCKGAHDVCSNPHLGSETPSTIPSESVLDSFKFGPAHGGSAR